MVKKVIFLAIGIVLLTLGLVGGAVAQDDDSTVQYFFIACGDSVVMNLSGQMNAGLDVYYQVFRGLSATGDPLTTPRRVQADGAYAFSEQLPYNDGATLDAGAFASARISIARESDPTRTVFEDTADDIQDGCNALQNPASASIGLDDTAFVEQEILGSDIQSPFGDTLNAEIVITPEPIVVLGAREFRQRGRTSDPGLVFAECDSFLPGADPGLVYDSDNVRVFWSWFTSTRALMDEHLANAQYAVRLNTAPLVNVERSEVTLRGGNYWVFFVGNVGNLAPGHYEVSYNLTWANPVNDGFEDFGPGTVTPVINSLCNFDVRQNPDGLNVTISQLYNPTIGPVHELQN